MTRIPFRRPLLVALTLAAALGPAGSALAASGGPSSGAAAAASAASPEVVVRFKATAGAAERAGAARAAGLERLRATAGGASVGRVRGTRRLGGALRALRARDAVAWAGPNYVARAAAFEPDDPGVAGRTGEAGGWRTVQWNLAGPFGINVPGAWDAARAAGGEGGRGIRVAVLDTGVAYANRTPYRRSPDLPATRVKRGYDFVSDDPYPNDANGHGTFVATAIAGAANNAFGMAGIAYAADVIPVRVLNADGEGSSARIAQGIRYAADRGAHVVNVSIELYDPVYFQAQSITAAPEIRSALRYAARRGVTVVAAAGNASEPRVPSDTLESRIVYVGGTTEHGCLGEYSNSGEGMDLVAPGGGADADFVDDQNCRAADPPGRNVLQVTFRRARPARFVVPTNYKGTSMAAPQVAGTIALVLAARTLGRDPSPAAVGRHLKATARDLGVPGPDRRYGAGLLDAAAAVGLPPSPTSSG